ncbi:magnesium protoporphyrin IX methyltransferase [Palleronia sediminis]|uniref:Magnesium protoporphyrin IX methyltransferase n=1 Tax=Palleronia sediminis TaxID=2547833 RepID=A0A4V3B976_9RHOB|nr:magnesium protoporphyrin IX methyltransferase [Palleronia sediminis]TDL78229.1 magnesium protoporphyrin IX methyltransferase [Palleronia sediminis]
MAAQDHIGGAGWHGTRDRVEAYFDGTATRAWTDLTGEARVSRIRETVRAGRDRMRAMMLSRLPEDLAAARVLDAGCGTGAMAAELAARGADVVAVDVSPKLLEVAEARLDRGLRGQVRFLAGDMLAPDLGRFDAVIAMDSLLYYTREEVAAAVDGLSARCAGPVVFTAAPRTPLLMAMWGMGRMFPRRDRSPVMVPQAPAALARTLGRPVAEIGRITSGFYISTCMELHP